MPFVCPLCQRTLAQPRRWHYCKRVAEEELFQNKAPHLQPLYRRLHGAVTAWPGVSASIAKTCVVFLAQKTFLVVKVMKDALDLKFTLPVETDAFPVYKQQSYGKKTEHYIRLHDETDLDGDVLRLLQQAYRFATDDPAA